MAGGSYLPPKQLQYLEQKKMLVATEQTRTILPRVNIEDALPLNVLKLRFN